MTSRESLQCLTQTESNRSCTVVNVKTQHGEFRSCRRRPAFALLTSVIQPDAVFGERKCHLGLYILEHKPVDFIQPAGYRCSEKLRILVKTTNNESLVSTKAGLSKRRQGCDPRPPCGEQRETRAVFCRS